MDSQHSLGSFSKIFVKRSLNLPRGNASSISTCSIVDSNKNPAGLFSTKISSNVFAKKDLKKTGQNTDKEIMDTERPFTMNQEEDFKIFLRDFHDSRLKYYMCFAGKFRDQQLEAGQTAEAGFWNLVVNLCINERMRRNVDIRRLEYMYRTGLDPDQYS